MGTSTVNEPLRTAPRSSRRYLEERRSMRHLLLCTDYDGTIALHGRVDDDTIAALERLRESGRKLVMVTGRKIPDLQTVFSRFDLFDVIVAENGALLYWPDSEEEQVLAEPAPVERSEEHTSELQSRENL